jgi:hypothetical protein
MRSLAGFRHAVLIPAHIDVSSDSRHTSEVPSGPSKQCHFFTSAPSSSLGCFIRVKISAETTSTSQPHCWHQRREQPLRRMVSIRSVSMVICTLNYVSCWPPLNLYHAPVSCYSATHVSRGFRVALA